MAIDLKPCPFCGGRCRTYLKRVSNRRSGFFAECVSCGKRDGAPNGSVEAAHEKWNTRSDADAQAEIARLRGALEACREALDSCAPGDYSTGHVIHPYFDEDAVNAAQDLLDGLGI